ncbi:MAG: Ig domain-containing protein [Acidobacteria bacterium]|nr:MAG: Ig domain-containing protein [Acidobacteriota bacterium]
MILLMGCGGGGNSGSSNPPSNPSSPAATLTSLQLTPASQALAPGAGQQFTATGHYSDGTSKDLTSSAQWSSSDSNVASVSGTGMATAVAFGVVTVTAQSGSLQATATVNVSSAGTNLTAISISPAGASIPIHTTQQFTATGSYSDGSSRDLTGLVSWGSSSTAAATIDVNGLLTGVAAGSTTISATLGSVTKSTTITVTVPTIASISVTPVGLTLGIGINQQYTATASYSDGSTQDLVSGVTWSSSSTSVATINSSGLANTLAAGTTTITATVGSLSDTSTLTIVPAHLTSIEVSPSTPSIALGTTQQFTAVGNFDDGSTQLLTSVTWAASLVSISTIDAAGLATAVGTGTTTISATSGSVTGTATLTVSTATLVSLAVTPANSTMAIGTSKQFTATGTFSDTSTQDLTASVLWSSSQATVATINNLGLATSVALGSATITATLGTVSGSTGLTVANVHLVSITISPANPRIAKGTSIKFTATGNFSDGSTSTKLSGLSWKTSKPSIVQIKGAGVAHGKKAGSVTITATASGVKGTTTLTVGSGKLVSLTIAPASPSVALGSTQQFAATGSFNDGTTQDITLTTHWSSSSSSVATIANAPSVAGVATTHGVGSTVIGANSGGITHSTTMTVH